MVVLNRIYTRTGDKGDTALATGERVPKDDARIEAYGTSDELNSVLGLVRLHVTGEIDELIGRIQNDLFDLGADLATPQADDLGFEPLRIIDSQVDALEAEIDKCNERLEPLRSFILPGGNAASAHLHLARTVSRRAERAAVRLARQAEINPAAIKYLNRLSDLFFVLARIANDEGKSDILWTPGANR